MAVIHRDPWGPIEMISLDRPLARVSPLSEGLERLTRILSRRSVSFSLKALVSGVLLFAVSRKIATVAIWEQFETQAVTWLAVAALLTATQILLGALRWSQILQALGAKLPAETVLNVTYISSFFTSWLFGVLGGDAARAVLIPSQEQGRAAMVYSVLFDRVLTVGGLGLVVLPGVVFGIAPFGHDLPLLVALAVAALPMAGMTVLAWMAGSRQGNRGGALSAHIAALARSWRRLLHEPGRFAAALAVSAVGQFAIAGVAYSLARAQHLDVSLLDFVMLMPPVVLLTTLPVSAGGWGVRESAMVAMLAVIGIAPSSALLVSVEMGVLAALISLPAGAMWVFQYRVRPRLLATANP
jgi:hypothetical protein